MVNRISKYRTMIADAPRLNLTEPQLGGLWARIASDYQDLADFAQSEAAYARALSLFEHNPATQESYAITLGDLGSLYGLTGRFDAEENCRRRSLAIFEKLGDRLQIARAQAHLADGYLAMGKNKLAERYSSQAIQAMTSLPGATGQDKGSVLVTFAYATCLTGHCDKGLRGARDAMAIVQANFAPESFPSGQTHVALGFLEQKTGDSVHAEEDLREGIRILRHDLPPSHPLLTHALMLYRNFLAENHRDVEARRIADEAQTHGCATCTVSVYGLRQQ
jgi:tetratricopeptide (TPR) repeat protein